MSQPITPLPSWLDTPPNSEVLPPVETKAQDLPFDCLSWEDFQRLCLRLVRFEANVEHCQTYGTPGQKQEGIDLFARQKLSEKYRVYQCKRVEDFGPADIKKAVEEFLEGNWVDRTELFVLCTQDTLVPTKKAEEIEAQNKVLKAKGITLIPWGAEELSASLKSHPEVVNDFFSREWVKKFIGEEAAALLGKRLDAGQVREYRIRCKQLYSNVFENHDPGIPSAQIPATSNLPLISRFVVPDIYDWQWVPSQSVSESEEPKPPVDLGESSLPSLSDGHTSSVARTQKKPEAMQYQQRVTLEEWISKGDCHVVLGGPGAGKSALLRYIAIQLLSESPSVPRLQEKWGNRLPIWIPFALWTKIISSSPSGEGSLGDAVQQWLKTWNELRLWPIFEQAIDDERVLLLVDGLDEWTNESAGKIALDRLQVFVRQRKVGAIVTSRPHGYKRLGMQRDGWQVGELCELSVAQQKELATIWFTQKVATSSSGLEREEINRLALFESAGFMEQLGRSSDLSELAKLPMLICLLIFLRFQNAHLPQSRFKAYGQIVDHLILVHPKKRQTAASITSSEGELSDEDLKGLLAYLALEIHEKHSEGLVDKKIAEEILRERIEQDFGFDRPKAIALGRYAIQTSENAVGLIVAKSPMELGFLHRTFQEYLAAWGLSTMPYAVISEKIEAHCADYQWHEVIFALLILTPRTEDVDSLLKKISEKRTAAITIDRYAIDRLLYDSALVHSKCSIEFANTVALEAFKTIESGSWKPHRLRVVRTVVDGLRQPRLRNVIVRKLRSWYPARQWSRASVFNGMAGWKRDREIIACLERGLLDEMGFNQRAAATAIARVGRGDHEIGEKVAVLSKVTESPSARAAAIEALIRGWPAHSSLEAILSNGVQSLSPEIQAASLYGKVKKGLHLPEDLNRLLDLGKQHSGLDHSWREIVHEGIKLGWTGSAEVRTLCFRSLERHGYRDDSLEREIAIGLLLECYPQDEEVAQYCVGEIQNERYPFLAAGMRSDIWKLVAVNFRDHQNIISAIDAWIPRQEYQEPDVSAAALVGRTSIAKAKLLALNKNHIPFWSAKALLDGWGMSDPKVSALLTGMAYASAAETSQIGHLLPRIVTNPSECRRRLLEVLKDPSCERPDFVLQGLRDLGNTQGDNEAIEIVLECLKRDIKFGYRYGAMASIFANFSQDLRVRELALKELDVHEGQYGAIAAAYADDAEIRSRVMEIACPLPSYVRKQIVESVTRGLGDEKLEQSILALYDLEHEADLKIASSIGFHGILKRTHSSIAEHLDDLKRTLFCLGPDYEERRQGAFCGLVVLGESEYIRTAREPWERAKQFEVPIRIHGEPSIPFVQFLLDNWKECKSIIFNGIDEADEEALANVWEELCLIAHSFEEPRIEALQFLESRSGKTAGPNILRFVARAKPRSKLLLDLCISTLIRRDQNLYGPTPKAAAELLADHFAGDVEVKKLIPPVIDAHRRLNSYVLMALSEGWPDSEEIAMAMQLLRDRMEHISPAPYYAVVCARSNTEKVFMLVMDELANAFPGYGLRLQLLVRPLLRRIRKDEGLAVMLKKRLFADPTPSEKSSISRLLAASQGVSKDVRDWCMEELNRQVREGVIPELGADLFEGTLRPVRHSLLDVLADR
ncbi:MAG: hypothetical protein E8D46_12615 [Nitrospira sp.]|nr:MAG: hypothetical protein E8D46_12615 [Nitrospira sp.]